MIRGLQVVSEIAGQPKVNLIGVCAGGLTAGVAAGVLKARGDQLINCLSLFINTLDNRTADSDFGLFVTDRSIDALKLRSRTRGVFPERNVFEMFAWLRLEENVLSFYRSNYLLGEKPPAHPLLFWSMDYTRLPAELHCDFLDLTRENKLAKRQLQMLGHRVDLKAIDYDVYMMAGSTDHITPWKACYRSVPLFGGNIEFVLTNQNHTQTISARGDNRHLKFWTAAHLPETADQFVEVAQETRGSWRAHWVNWLKARSGEEIVAPQTLGSVGYPCIDDAPGKYVLQR